VQLWNQKPLKLNTFSRLFRVENSPYFLAKQEKKRRFSFNRDNEQETVMLSIKENHVESTSVISKSESPFKFRPHSFIMLRDESSIVSVNQSSQFSDHRHLYQQEKNKKQY